MTTKERAHLLAQHGIEVGLAFVAGGIFAGSEEGVVITAWPGMALAIVSLVVWYFTR